MTTVDLDRVIAQHNEESLKPASRVVCAVYARL
jgi:hypothetical protein